MGPTIAVMPAPDKPFEVFQQDQALCKQYSDQQVAGGAQQASNQQVLTGAVDTALGAGVGAALGGGSGAEVGGVPVPWPEPKWVRVRLGRRRLSLQRRHDTAYAQRMYSRGNQVPGYTPAYTPPPPPLR